MLFTTFLNTTRTTSCLVALNARALRTPCNASEWSRHASTASSTTSNASNTSWKSATKGRPRYPDVMMIYHAGAWRMSVLGLAKTATFVVFGFVTVCIAPDLYKDENMPNWASYAAVIGSVVPLAFTAFYSRPFVTSIHIRLPLHARASVVTLTNFVKNVPASTKLDISTMRTIPVPSTRQIRLGQLRKIKSGFGSISNLGVVETGLIKDGVVHPLSKVPETTSFWNRPLREFYVGTNRAGENKDKLWEPIYSSIPKA